MRYLLILLLLTCYIPQTFAEVKFVEPPSRELKVWKARDSIAKAYITFNGAPYDMSDITKATVLFNDSEYLDSDTCPTCFDFTTDADISHITLNLGSKNWTETTDSTAKLILYDTTHTNGVVVGTFKMVVSDDTLAGASPPDVFSYVTILVNSLFYSDSDGDVQHLAMDESGYLKINVGSAPTIENPSGSGTITSVNTDEGPDVVLDADDIDDTSTTNKFVTQALIDTWNALVTFDWDYNFDDLTNVPSGLADGDDDTQLNEAQVDSYVSNNGYAPTASPTFTGKATTEASDTAEAGFNIPHGVAPTSPVNGDIWSTTLGLYSRINGATVGPYGVAGSGTDANAIHDNVASEISGITEKASPISGDMLIIEDSEDSNNKKRILIGNLPGNSTDDQTIDVSELDGTTLKLSLEGDGEATKEIDLSSLAPVSLLADYSFTDNSTNWDAAYADRLKWDGGAIDLVPATGRGSLGATTIGGNIFTLANPSAVTFLRVNADNTPSLLGAADFRTAIGAGTSSFSPSTLLNDYAFGTADINTDGTIKKMTGEATDNPFVKFWETDGTSWWAGIDDAGDSFEFRTSETVGTNVKIELDEDGELHLYGAIYLFGTSDAPTTINQLLYDNTITGLTRGALSWHDGTNVRYIVDLDAAPTNDDYVVAYDADADKFYMKEDATGSGFPGFTSLFADYAFGTSNINTSGVITSVPVGALPTGAISNGDNTHIANNDGIYDFATANFLKKDNTNAFTPTADYHPATYKYVNDTVAAAGGYTDDDAQDAVGGILDDGTDGDIVFAYGTSPSNKISANVEDDSHNHVITNIDSFTKSELETQTSDVADFAEADGDTYSGTHDFGGATLEIPNANSGDQTVTEGQTKQKSHEDAIVYHFGTVGEIQDEALISAIRTIPPIVFDPTYAYAQTTQHIVPIGWVGDDFPSGMIITEWKLSYTADPTTELDADLMYADAQIGLANAAIIDALDTTSGASSEDTNANINSGNAVINGKFMYILINADPTDDNTLVTFQYWCYAPED